MTHRGPFQPLRFSDSDKLVQRWVADWTMVAPQSRGIQAQCTTEIIRNTNGRDLGRAETTKNSFQYRSK